MPESKSGALPLGYIPIFTTSGLYHKFVLVSSVFESFIMQNINKNITIDFVIILCYNKSNKIKRINLCLSLQITKFLKD